MASKHVEKFAIRKRADGVIRDRKRIERLDETLRGSYLPAKVVAESFEIVEADLSSPAHGANP